MINKKRFPTWFRILLAVFTLLAILVTGFVTWGLTPARPMVEAMDSLRSDDRVNVEQGKWLTFSPADSQPDIGFIVYPGGRVDYRAYAPAAREIADNGYLVVIVRMPLNLAVFNPDAAAEIMDAHPEIDHWAVGGHSLGGAMAANFIFTHPGDVDGLVLWGAYPAESNDLSRSSVRVVSISGTNDGLATPGKISASTAFLPMDTDWVQIEGGNHAQFGWYGEQAGDSLATISREEQQAQMVEATVRLLSALK